MPDWMERKASALFSYDDAEETFAELADLRSGFQAGVEKDDTCTHAIFIDIDGNESIIGG